MTIKFPLRPLRLCEGYSELWLRLRRAGTFVVKYFRSVLSILCLLEFPHGITVAVVAFQKQRLGLAHGAGHGDPVEQLTAVVTRRVDTLFRGAPRERLILAAHEQLVNRFGPFRVDPTAQRTADVHGEAAAGDKRDAL